MKLDAWQKSDRKAMKMELQMMGGFTVSCKWLGLTAAAMPAINSDNARFVRIAIAQCDFRDDKFKRKAGEWVALTRLMNDEIYVSVPLNGRTVDETVGDYLAVFE